MIFHFPAAFSFALEDAPDIGLSLTSLDGIAGDSEQIPIAHGWMLRPEAGDFGAQFAVFRMCHFAPADVLF
jgi:hypothetical protein